MYFFIMHSLCLGLETDTCIEYTCSNGPTRTTCIQLIGTSFEISPCVTGLLCDLTPLNTPTTSWETVECIRGSPVLSLCEDFYASLFTGEECCVNSNCRSDQCVNSRCAGSSEGDSCIFDEECMPEFYCNGVCTASVSGACIRDNMCPVGYGCNNTNCIPLHSMALAEYADREVFCKTGFMFKGMCDAVDAYLGGSLLGTSRSCTVGGDPCVYMTRNKHTQIDESDCMCAGIANNQSGYCGLHANQSVDMESFYEAAWYRTSACSGIGAHTDSVDTIYSCGAISYKQFEYASIMMDRYQYFNLYMSGAIDHCSRPLGAFDPWYDPSTYSRLEYLFPALLSFCML